MEVLTKSRVRRWIQVRDANYDETLMSETVEFLILDLLEWIGPNSRPYDEVIDAWRTSCPRLPVWEDANDRGFVSCRREAGHGRLVSVSDAGRDHLRQRRPTSAEH
jgi:hypothetical protein